MTLERPPVGSDDDELAAWHDAQLALIFAAPAGGARALAASRYGALLLGWAEEANAVRDVEVWRLKADGWGPSQLSRSLGLHKSRGAQLLDRAVEVHAIASQAVARIRRRVNRRREHPDGP
jgi:hypothetical protein